MAAGGRRDLTERQRLVFRAIRRHFARHGTAPTFRALMAATGIGTPNGVLGHLKALERKGWIRRGRYAPRGITLVGYRVRLVREDGHARA